MEETIKIFDRDILVSTLTVDQTAQRVSLINHRPIDGLNWLHMPFGKITDLTWLDFTEFISTRCFPYERGNRKALLKIWGLDEYDPMAIVRKTHGVMNDDFLWLLFEGETLTFEDVRMR